MKIEPCPLCGARYKSNLVEVDYFILHGHRVICNLCGANTGWKETKNEAIETWNRRAKQTEKTCYNCSCCIPIGEGDHACEKALEKIIIEDYTPTDDYFWCNGKYHDHGGN